MHVAHRVRPRCPPRPGRSGAVGPDADLPPAARPGPRRHLTMTDFLAQRAPKSAAGENGWATLKVRRSSWPTIIRCIARASRGRSSFVLTSSIAECPPDGRTALKTIRELTPDVAVLGSSPTPPNQAADHRGPRARRIADAGPAARRSRRARWSTGSRRRGPRIRGTFPGRRFARRSAMQSSRSRAAKTVHPSTDVQGGLAAQVRAKPAPAARG